LQAVTASKGFERQWDGVRKMPASVESYLRVAAEHLLGHATVTRGESRRDVQLADFVHVELEKEVPKPGQLGHVNETEAESAWQG
jgi:hypothetical protein